MRSLIIFTRSNLRSTAGLPIPTPLCLIAALLHVLHVACCLLPPLAITFVVYVFQAAGVLQILMPLVRFIVVFIMVFIIMVFIVVVFIVVVFTVVVIIAIIAPNFWLEPVATTLLIFGLLIWLDRVATCLLIFRLLIILFCA